MKYISEWKKVIGGFRRDYPKSKTFTIQRLYEDLSEEKTSRDQAIYYFLLEEFVKHHHLVGSVDDRSDEICLGAKEDLEKSIQLSFQLLQSIVAYLHGDFTLAQKLFFNGLDCVEQELALLGMEGKLQPSPKWLFRTRVLRDLSRLRTVDLFHVPFSERQHVAHHRFSIPGIPSLYASASSYACWEELGRPDLARTATMGLFIKDRLRVLDLSQHDHYIAGIKQETFSRDVANTLRAQTVCWPLIRACHVAERFPDASFHEEHIIPQLLLTWIRSRADYHGIRYFAARVSQRTSPVIGSSYVFPVRVVDERRDYCSQLAAQFKVTAPLHWAISRIANHKKAKDRDENVVEILPGIPMPYNETDFFTFDCMIRWMDLVGVGED